MKQKINQIKYNSKTRINNNHSCSAGSSCTSLDRLPFNPGPSLHAGPPVQPQDPTEFNSRPFTWTTRPRIYLFTSKRAREERHSSPSSLANKNMCKRSLFHIAMLLGLATTNKTIKKTRKKKVSIPLNLFASLVALIAHNISHPSDHHSPPSLLTKPHPTLPFIFTFFFQIHNNLSVSIVCVCFFFLFIINRLEPDTSIYKLSLSQVLITESNDGNHKQLISVSVIVILFLKTGSRIRSRAVGKPLHMDSGGCFVLDHIIQLIGSRPLLLYN